MASIDVAREKGLLGRSLECAFACPLWLAVRSRDALVRRIQTKGFKTVGDIWDEEGMTISGRPWRDAAPLVRQGIGA